MLASVVLVLVLLTATSGAQGSLKIGGVLNDALFDRTIKITSKHNSTETLTRQLPKDDLLEATNAACSLIQDGVAVIFADSTSNGVEGVCTKLQVPYISMGLEMPEVRSPMYLNIHPNPREVAEALLSLTGALGWSRAVIVYEDEDSYLRAGELLRMAGGVAKVGVTLRQLDDGKSGNYRNTFNEIKKTGETNLIIICQTQSLFEVLDQAQQIGLMSSDYNFLIANMDLHLINLDRFKYGGAKIFGLSIFDPEDVNVISFGMLAGLDEREARMLTSRSVLLADAAMLFSSVLVEMNVTEVPKMTCMDGDGWKDGPALVSRAKSKFSKGLTGLVKFGTEGFRSDFNLEIIKLTEDGLSKIGYWNRVGGVVLHDPDEDGSRSHGETLVVEMILNKPYCMIREVSYMLKGNDRFEGFAVDLMRELATLGRFNYTIIIRLDGRYGNMDYETGVWNGVIGDIMNQVADIAVTDMTITSKREEAVDFTTPFTTLGIGILYRKPKTHIDYFFFLKPFSWGVWLSIAICYVSVSALLFIISRTCRSDRTKCLDFQVITMDNAFWCTTCGLAHQGCKPSPKSAAARTLLGFWWIFVGFVGCLYVASMAAMLIEEKASFFSYQEASFSNAQELLRSALKGEVKFGALKQGSTVNFFRDSNFNDYKQIYEYMMDNEEDVMMNSYGAGVERVLKDRYAFFMESTSIDYETSRNCELLQVGDLLNEKGFGIAMRKNAHFRNLLSGALLKLREDGKLDELKRKWWSADEDVVQCTLDTEEAHSIGTQNLKVLFYLLIVGVTFSLICGIVELLLNVRTKSSKNQTTFVDELVDELRFCVQFDKNTRETRSS